MILSSPNPFAWDRCDHSGIGQPGCPTCDPDKDRCLQRRGYLAYVENKDALDGLLTAADYAAKMERERDSARATAERFRLRFRKAEAAIAKARKHMRTPPMSVGVTKAYAALDWRNR